MDSVQHRASGSSDVGTVPLSGQRVVLTGALGGIGMVAARRLAQAGATLCLSDIADTERGERILRDAGWEDLPAYVACNTTSPEEVSHLFDTVHSELGGEADTVFVHAGVVHTDELIDLDVEVFDHVFNVNVRGSFLVASEAARRWRKAGSIGHLVFTTSWVQDVPWPGIGAYSASKAAVRSLMRTFARELAAEGIRANSVAPGIVGVGMARRQWDTDDDYRSRAGRAIPLGELQTPESVAETMVFLASSSAKYMTGSTLLVDGGASLYPMD